MPTKPNSACAHPGCSARPDGTYCEKHKTQHKTERPNYHKLYDKKWEYEREKYLEEHGLCVKCKEKGILRSATVVDHIEPHKGDLELFWDKNNWQALCESCHNEKSAKEKYKQ